MAVLEERRSLYMTAALSEDSRAGQWCGSLAALLLAVFVAEARAYRLDL